MKNKIIYMLAIFVLLLINFTTPIISVQANSTTDGKVFIPKKSHNMVIKDKFLLYKTKKVLITLYQNLCSLMCENTNSDTNRLIYRSEYTKSDTKFMTCETRNKKNRISLLK